MGKSKERPIDITPVRNPDVAESFLRNGNNDEADKKLMLYIFSQLRL